MTKASVLISSVFTTSTLLAAAVFACGAAASGASAQHASAQRAADAPKVARVTVNVPVTLTDNGDSWTMDNGIVRMTILKRNGTIGISSLKYHGVDIVPNRSEF